MAVAPLGLDPTAIYHAVRARPDPSVDGETIEQHLARIPKLGWFRADR